MNVPGFDKVASKGNVHRAVEVVEQTSQIVVPRDGIPRSLDHRATTALLELQHQEHVRREGEVVHREPSERSKTFRRLNDVIILDHLRRLEEEGVALNLLQWDIVAALTSHEELNDAHLAECLSGHGQGEEVERDLGVAVAEIRALDVGTEAIERIRRAVLARKPDSRGRRLVAGCARRTLVGVVHPVAVAVAVT